MKNIWKLFRNDIEHIRKSVIGMIVMVGLVIVPVLYAWFNIAGSWDPYGNTGNLKVAVANEDEGYLSDLVPIKVNIGDSVVSSLRANDALDWEFVNEDDAIEGVKAGTYYAAVVIPEDFSANMMTLFSTEVKHSDIIYYENQKANAIAPRVTDKGASTIRQQIDETFTSTVGDIGLATSSTLLDFMSGDEVVNFIANLSATLDTGIESLRDAATNYVRELDALTKDETVKAAIAGYFAVYDDLDASTPATEKLVAALESQQVADYIAEKYDGAVVSTVENPGDGYDASVDYAALAGQTISVAASPTPHAEILEVAKEILAEKDITLDIQTYNDYVVPNTVVEDGTVDANYFQHTPYLDDFNKENGTHIVSVAAIHVEPMGLYGGKQTTLDALK